MGHRHSLWINKQEKGGGESFLELTPKCEDFPEMSSVLLRQIYQRWMLLFGLQHPHIFMLCTVKCNAIPHVAGICFMSSYRWQSWYFSTFRWLVLEHLPALAIWQYCCIDSEYWLLKLDLVCIWRTKINNRWKIWDEWIAIGPIRVYRLKIIGNDWQLMDISMEVWHTANSGETMMVIIRRG